MSYGVTAEGFVIKRLPEIKQGIIDDLKSLFPNIDTSDDSVVGQLVSLNAQRETELWEQLGNVYANQHPSEAQKIHLDYLLEFNNLARLRALKSSVTIGLNSGLDEEIPSGTQVQSEAGDLFELIDDTFVENVGLQKAYIRIGTVEDDTTYTITINEEDVYAIDSGQGATTESIAAALLEEIEEDVDAVITATSTGNGDLQIDIINPASSFMIEFTESMLFFYPAEFESVEYGNISVSKYTIDEIVTPTGTLEYVNNFESGESGREEETDAEVRIRRLNSLQIVGGGTLPSIVARLQNEITGVTAVQGYENRTDIEDGEGRPPHSIHIIIEGGDNEDIANLLWEIKPAGIQTFGSENIEITDSNGDTQIINFDRPIEKYIWVNIELTLLDEEDFPENGITLVKQKILEYGNTLLVGGNVVPQRFFGSIFGIPGIESIFIEVASTDEPDGEPVYQEEPIEIDINEKTVFDVDRIEVTVN